MMLRTTVNADGVVVFRDEYGRRFCKRADGELRSMTTVIFRSDPEDLGRALYTSPHNHHWHLRCWLGWMFYRARKEGYHGIYDL